MASKLSIIIFALASSVLGFPAQQAQPKTLRLQARDGPGHPFVCTNPPADEVARRKENLLSEGAKDLDIAIGMLENGCALKAVYPIGGTYPNGSPKTGDSAEIGVFRNNWGMIRQYCDGFKGASADEWATRGQELHNNEAAAVKCQQQCISALGLDGFFDRQRGGSSSGGGEEYASAIRGTYLPFLQSDGGVHLHDGMATYYDLHPQ